MKGNSTRSPQNNVSLLSMGKPNSLLSLQSLQLIINVLHLTLLVATVDVTTKLTSKVGAE